MVQMLVLLTGVWLWLLPAAVRAEPVMRGAEIEMPPEYVGHRFPVAGMPYVEAFTIFKRHYHQLLQLPGVKWLDLRQKGLMVYTDKPDVVPQEVEGLPIYPIASLDQLPELDPKILFQADQGPAVPQAETAVPPEWWPKREIPDVAGMPYEQAEAIVKRHKPALKQIPGVHGVWVGKEGIDIQIYDPAAQQALPPTLEGLPVHVEVLHVLPPPPGVIVLRPGGVREAAEACPEGFREVKRLGWRFCVDKEKPEVIPALMTPPIKGIPYEEALAILERHRAELLALPGVSMVGMGSDGIQVWTKQPDLVPSTLEGVPVKAVPPLGSPRGTNHTINPNIRPVHGSIFVRDTIGFSGTLSGVVLSKKQPWLVFPAHLLFFCQATPPCPIATTAALNDCPHGLQPNTQLLDQPALPPPANETIGLTQRWDPLVAQGLSTDLAAAFFDNDAIEGNLSLHCDRKIEVDAPLAFKGSEDQPMMNEEVTVFSSASPHDFPAKVTGTNVTALDAKFNCSGNTLIDLPAQMVLQATTGIFFTRGDSGSPVLDTDGNLIGMVNWIAPEEEGDPFAVVGGGNTALTIKNTLRFDQWYGVNTSGFPLRCN